MDDLDRRLHDAGADFRAAHTRPAPELALDRRPARRGWRLPAAAAVATAAVVGAVALLLPSNPSAPPPQPAVTPSTSLTDFALPVQSVDDVALGEDIVVYTFGSLGQADRGSLQVRRRDDLGTVVFTVQTSYANGSLRCLHVDGDWVLWTDFESIPSDLIPGPITRHSLWLHNLRTGEQRKLLERLPTERFEGAPCAVGSGGTVAWNPVTGMLSLLDLATGQTSTTPVDGDAVAVLPTGVLLQRPRGDDVEFVLRTGTVERVVHVAKGVTAVVAEGNRLLWFEKDPKGETEDGSIVRTCTLPACSDVRLLANDPTASWGVIGSSFVAWSGLDESPTLRSLTGGALPRLAPGYVFFRAKAALGSTFAYVTATDPSTPEEKATLHLVTIDS